MQHLLYLCWCIHYGSACNWSRGICPNQRQSSLDCPAKVTVSFDRKVNELVVQECILDHNHWTGLEIMIHYPSQRRLTNSESKEIEGVLKLGANKKLVKQQIQKSLGKWLPLKIFKTWVIKLKKWTKGCTNMFGQAFWDHKDNWWSCCG